MKRWRWRPIALTMMLVLLTVFGTSTGAGEGESQGGDIEVRAVLGTTFIYQGQLTHGRRAYTGACDFQLSLWTEETGGSWVGSTETKADVRVERGAFAVQLDFGSGAFNGTARWLETAVKCGQEGSYATLLPRQAVLPVPYAMALPGLRVEQNATSPSLIGGYSGNTVMSGAVGATVAGGGSSGSSNTVTDDYAAVGGGRKNRAGNSSGTTSDAGYATVGGGSHNTASGSHTTIAGGYYNAAGGRYGAIAGGAGNAARGYAAIGGGWRNTAGGYAAVAGGWGNTADELAATIGGGSYNTAAAVHASVGGGHANTASGGYATIGGGHSNKADGGYATVAGGHTNTAGGKYASVGGGHINIATGDVASVAGGYNNTASGYAASVVGGQDNEAAGQFTLVGGRRAIANHEGTFVWADSNDFDFVSTSNNQFIARSTGGVHIVSAIDASGSAIAGVELAPGASSWSCLSDSNIKENFFPMDDEEVLARLAQLPIATWNYKAQNPSVRHMGPVAQDFYAAFGLGEDDRHISALDTSGVGLAAIQGLYRMVQEKDTEIAALEARLAALEGLVAELGEGQGT